MAGAGFLVLLALQSLFLGLRADTSVSQRLSSCADVYQTARDTDDRITWKQCVPLLGDAVLGQNWTVAVDTSQTYQQILGFGGAFTEAASYVFSLMNPDVQQEILNAYFGPTNSNLYTLGRVPIGSCDFSLGSYSYDDTAGDYSMEYFSIEHDQELIIPFIKQAVSLSEESGRTFKMFGSPWSPPAWMKKNGAMNGSAFEGLISDPQTQQAWALYISRFIREYRNTGIPVWAITPQNEPTSDGSECGSSRGDCEACQYTASYMKDFIKGYLGPQVKTDFPDITIMMLDDDKEHLNYWAREILDDADASQYIDGIGVHWYWVFEDFYRLDAVHDSYPSKFLLATEACNCHGVKLGDWSRGEKYGKDILGDLAHWVTGWVDWNLVLDTNGGPNHGENWCDAPLIANTTDGTTLYYQPPYWYMGHFTRFLPPGSTRVAVNTLEESDVQAVPFQLENGSIAVVVLNLSDSQYDYQIQLVQQNQFVVITLPSHSIQTVLIAA
ncbi:glycoside hydrolase family 30 protein [Pelomyxa schiedti]|nr:glycoside hydrolase family 30 protein [Pelomyxa schiedti]